MKTMSYVGVFSILLMFIGQAIAAEVAGEVVSVEGSVFVRPDGRMAAKLAPAKSGDPVSAGDVINTPSNGKIKILMKDKSIVDIGPSALFKIDGFKLNGGTDREADVSMMYGTLRAAVTQKLTGKGRFKVKTPSATMGVRGTEFVVKSEVKNMDEIRHVIMNPNKPLPAQAAARAGGTTAPDGKGMSSAPEAAKTEIVVLQGQVDVKKEAPTLPDGRVPANYKEAKVISLTAGTQLITQQGEIEAPKPVMLDSKQLAAISSEVKLSDNTFSRAVVIDTAATQGEAVETVRMFVASAMAAAPPTPVVSMGDLGVAGTFGVADTFISQPVTQTGSVMKNLKVIVRRVGP